MRDTLRPILAAALLSVCSASPLADLAEKNGCGFKPSTTYTSGDAALTAVIGKAQVTGPLRDMLLEGGWSPIDGCTSWCCKCAATAPDSPYYYPTACKPSALAPAPTEAAQLELRDIRLQTRTLTLDGTAVFVPLVNYAEMATACGFGHNSAASCGAQQVGGVREITRTLEGGMIFISYEYVNASPTPVPPVGASPKSPAVAPPAAPAPMVSAAASAPPAPKGPAPAVYPGLGSPIATVGITVPTPHSELPGFGDKPAYQSGKPLSDPALPSYAGGKHMIDSSSLKDQPTTAEFGGVVKMPAHYRVHSVLPLPHSA